jgi:hypothetical protein
MPMSSVDQPLPLALPAQRDELVRGQLAPIFGELTHASERVVRIEDETPFRVDADFKCGPPSTGLVAEVQSLGCGLPNTHLVPRVEAGAEIPGRRAGQRTSGSIVTDQNAKEEMSTQVPQCTRRHTGIVSQKTSHRSNESVGHELGGIRARHVRRSVDAKHPPAVTRESVRARDRSDALECAVAVDSDPKPIMILSLGTPNRRASSRGATPWAARHTKTTHADLDGRQRR